MFYILKSDDVLNLKPEIEYSKGITLQFKKGLFIFNDEKDKQKIFAAEFGLITDKRGERFRVHDSLTFSNEIKAEIVFLKLKIKELEDNSFSFYMPKEFDKYVVRFNELITEYPEQLI